MFDQAPVMPHHTLSYPIHPALSYQVPAACVRPGTLSCPSHHAPSSGTCSSPQCSPMGGPPTGRWYSGGICDLYRLPCTAHLVPPTSSLVGHASDSTQELPLLYMMGRHCLRAPQAPPPMRTSCLPLCHDVLLYTQMNHRSVPPLLLQGFPGEQR